MAKYKNFKSNLEVLRLSPQKDLDDEFITSGIINKFSMQFELSWKLLKCLLKHDGVRESDTGSPRSIIRSAYASYDFIDEDVWLKMLDDRNNAEHVYDSNHARQLVDRVISDYIPAFENLLNNIESNYDSEFLQDI